MRFLIFAGLKYSARNKSAPYIKSYSGLHYYNHVFMKLPNGIQMFKLVIRIDQNDKDKYLIIFNMYNISAAGFLTAPTALDSVDEYRGNTFDTISEYQCSTIFIQPLQKTGRIQIQGLKNILFMF